jgi:hypothetical protein
LATENNVHELRQRVKDLERRNGLLVAIITVLCIVVGYLVLGLIFPNYGIPIP